ncbi:acyl-CoA dehydrogenase family protein [Streptomyces sp. NPDC056169]|uniref:acyl-CoA dehydrogenase family protein n=1 Tax=Streptomyces sp. NPDC056169 TaxID=3345734 RepID=UPI0035DBB0E5
MSTLGGTGPAVPVGVRIDAVEAALGDPRDPANPVGWAAVLAADEERVLPPAGVALYDRLGLNAEFVPASLGGRLHGTDELGPVLRALFRRDAALGVGSALTSFMAATAVWAFGDDAQRARTAEALLDGGRATIAYHRFAHGNDFVSDELHARRTADGYRLDGRKRAVHNAQDARLVVAFARTDEGDDTGRGHSLFLLDAAALTGPRVRRGETRPAAGMRGLRVGSLEFTERPLPRTALLGSWGGGVRHSLSVFPLIHAAVPSMVIGVSDTALRTAALYATEQRPFSRPLPQVSYARTAVAGAFADLLLADALARTAARALHLLPGGSPVLAAAAKYLVPAGVEENLNALSVILGGAFHARDGAYAILQKHVRDFPTVTFGHVGNVVCQTVMAQHLGWIGSGRWTGEAPPPAALFRPGPVLPPLDPAVFTAADGRDGLCALLAEAPGEHRLAGDDPVLRSLRAQLRLLAAETVRLQEACAGLGRFGAGPYPSRVFPLTDRYALLLAAAAGFGVWRESPPDTRAADPGWLAVALHRILRRLGRSAPPLPPGVEAGLCEEVLRRAAEARSYDLDDRVLAG